MNESTAPAPSGWYPDPSGQDQWRVWTGLQWSNVTRPFHSGRASAREVLASLDRVRSIARVRYLAPLGYFTGLNLLASILTNWPTGSNPFSKFWLLPLLGMVVFCLVMAWAITAQAVRSFQSHWTFWALLPIGNLLVLMGLLRRELLGNTAHSTMNDAVGMAMWMIVVTTTPFAGIITALIAFAQIQLTNAYLENVILR